MDPNLVSQEHAGQQHLQYAQQGIPQQNVWQMPAVNAAAQQIPANVAHSPAAAAPQDAPFAPMMEAIETLIGAINTASSYGPGSPPHNLAQTFQPLLALAIDIQLKTMNHSLKTAAAGTSTGADDDDTDYAEYGSVKSERSGRERGRGRGRGRPRSGGVGAGAGAGSGSRTKNSERGKRSRKTNSKLAEYVIINDE